MEAKELTKLAVKALEDKKGEAQTHFLLVSSTVSEF